MPPKLKLSKADQVAKGTQRRVYRHPHDTTKVLKVLRRLPKSKGRSKLATMTERAFPSIRRRWARKEYEEYLRLMLKTDGKKFHPPITHMFGFTLTKKGLACLTEAVLDGDQLGETLEDLIRSNRLSSNDLDLFNDTVSRLYRYDIRAGDMTPRNFVFGCRTTNGVQGPRECVLVDGFGDIHAIPIRSLSRWTNHKGLDDSCARLARKTGLRWDAKARQFHLT